jgi:catechol 2,3-dioxygenase-like lactoylglutathione lyase family enzyme
VKLDHVAIWVVDIESMRTFYEKYFDARSKPLAFIFVFQGSVRIS